MEWSRSSIENTITYKCSLNFEKAAVSEGGVDAVLRQQLDMANEEIQQFKMKQIETQQNAVSFYNCRGESIHFIQAEAKSKRRHVETNTPEMDLAMIKSLTAQIKNQDIDLSVTKDALYRNMFHMATNNEL